MNFTAKQVREAFAKNQGEGTEKTSAAHAILATLEELGEDGVVVSVLLAEAFENGLYVPELHGAIEAILNEEERKSIKQKGIENIMGEEWDAHIKAWSKEIDKLSRKAALFLREARLQFARYDKKWGDRYYLFRIKDRNYLLNCHQDFPEKMDVWCKLTDEEARRYIEKGSVPNSAKTVNKPVNELFNLEIEKSEADMFYCVLGHEDFESLCEECEKAGA